MFIQDLRAPNSKQHWQHNAFWASRRSALSLKAQCAYEIIASLVCWKKLASLLPLEKFCYGWLHRRLLRRYRPQSAVNCSTLWERAAGSSPNTSQVSLLQSLAAPSTHVFTHTACANVIFNRCQKDGIENAETHNPHKRLSSILSLRTTIQKRADSPIASTLQQQSCWASNPRACTYKHPHGHFVGLNCQV